MSLQDNLRNAALAANEAADELDRLNTALDNARSAYDCGVAFHNLVVSQRDSERIKSDCLTTELAALREQVSTQKDWVLVPREPTEAMIDAGESLNNEPFNSQPTEEIYRAMIAAISKGETK